ncbi:calpain-13-like isoform X2 [Ranitomeya variabilis]|uniref:calpain-13-like isoform X2 n=1 Tax=Ranitomeya variabilis TaxID=490064 RepID=UPI004056E8D2
MPLPGVYQNVAEGQQSQRKIGTVENPKKFKGQDFNSIRDLCISRKQLFEDDVFPANLSSIGEKLLSQDKLLSIKWKRPTDLQRDARFLVDGASIFDIMQGEIGDCWVLSVVGALTLHRKFLANVIPSDQGYTYKYTGIFHFRFWQFGEWVDVVVDDRLPMLNGNFVFVQPRVSNEFWPSLLEKAYAKLRGSYQNLHWGVISEAMVDFTGGVPMYFNITKSPFELQNVILGAARSGSLMGCATLGNLSAGNIELPSGLIKGHAYTVTDSKKIEYKNRLEDIIRIWNPWGHSEWNGRWSDKAPQWDRVCHEIKKKLNTDKNDGEFWMSCEDFMQNYVKVYICNHTPTYLDFGGPQYVWKTTSYYNQWVRGSTAGGCGSTEDMWKNPQFIIIIPESQGPRLGKNVTVAVMQSLSNERKYNTSWLPIGFAFCKETQLTSLGLMREAEREWRCGPSFWSLAVEPYAGVAVLFNTNDVTVHRMTEVVMGRCLVLEVTIHERAKICVSFFIQVTDKDAKTGTQQQYSQHLATETIIQEAKPVREITGSFTAQPGTYVILPFTQHKGQESMFLLRIFIKTSQIAESPEMEPMLSEKKREIRSSSVPSQFSDNAAMLSERFQDLYYRRSSLQYSNNEAMLSERSREPSHRRLSSPYSNNEAMLSERSREPSHRRPSSPCSDNEAMLNERSRELSHRRPSSPYSDNEIWSSERSRERRSSSIQSHDSGLSVNTQNPKVVFNKYQDDNYENIFARYANQKSEMYAEHLQSLLNDEVITDQSFVADKEQFSLDSCRGMLLLMDLHGNGRLSLDEFARLWKRLNKFKNLFKTIDLNQTGFIDRPGLVKAIQDTGLVVSDSVLNIMILRYANYAQKMSFADFVCCMIRLETVTNVFQNLRKDGTKVYLSKENWLQILMSS